MIKCEPDTNLISRSKTFVLELLNPRSCCKPEQSADEKGSFSTSSTFFGQPSWVTVTSDKYCSQDAAHWIVVGLLWRDGNTDIVMLNDCNHCISLWNSLYKFLHSRELFSLLFDHISFYFREARRKSNPFSLVTKKILQEQLFTDLKPIFLSES